MPEEECSEERDEANDWVESKIVQSVEKLHVNLDFQLLTNNQPPKGWLNATQLPVSTVLRCIAELPLSKAIRPSEWVLSEVLAMDPFSSQISAFIEDWKKSWLVSPVLDTSLHPGESLPAVVAIREYVQAAHAQLLEQMPALQQSCTLEEVLTCSLLVPEQPYAGSIFQRTVSSDTTYL